MGHSYKVLAARIDDLEQELTRHSAILQAFMKEGDFHFDADSGRLVENDPPANAQGGGSD